MTSLFFSYSHRDEDLRDELEVHLAMMHRQGVIDAWHDRRIDAGSDFGREIDAHVDRAEIILLLMSPDFLASDYCYEREMTRALARHNSGDAVVMPVILRPCDWKHAPFAELNALPIDGRPVTMWPDRDQAFLGIVQAIRKVAMKKAKEQTSNSPAPSSYTGEIPTFGETTRSSNLRVTKHFTERDKDTFVDGAFTYIANFFENSLRELCDRNAGIEGSFNRIDLNRFTAVAYRDGKAASRCSVFRGAAPMGGGIAFASTDQADTNSFNEQLSVGNDDQSLYFRSLGFSGFRDGRQRGEEKLTFQGGAELYWGMFIAPLQR